MLDHIEGAIGGKRGVLTLLPSTSLDSFDLSTAAHVIGSMIQDPNKQRCLMLSLQSQSRSSNAMPALDNLICYLHRWTGAERQRN